MSYSGQMEKKKRKIGENGEFNRNTTENAVLTGKVMYFDPNYSKNKKVYSSK